MALARRGADRDRRRTTRTCARSPRQSDDSNPPSRQDCEIFCGFFTSAALAKAAFNRVTRDDDETCTIVPTPVLSALPQEVGGAAGGGATDVVDLTDE